MAACGCAEGAAGGLIGLFVAFFLATSPIAAQPLLAAGFAIVQAALGFGVGVIVGKLAGLALARRRLRRMVAELASIANTVPSTAEQ